MCRKCSFAPRWLCNMCNYNPGEDKVKTCDFDDRLCRRIHRAVKKDV
jgi:hypothetical protein